MKRITQIGLGTSIAMIDTIMIISILCTLPVSGRVVDSNLIGSEIDSFFNDYDTAGYVSIPYPIPPSSSGWAFFQLDVNDSTILEETGVGEIISSGTYKIIRFKYAYKVYAGTGLSIIYAFHFRGSWYMNKYGIPETLAFPAVYGPNASVTLLEILKIAD